MNNINLDNPLYLLIAIPLILLFVVPFAIAVRKSNRNKHNIASQIMHVAMAIIIAFAAARVSYTTVLTETDVYVVADVSYSANRNLDTIDEYIKALELPSNSKLGLVCFGKDQQLVSELDNPRKVASVREATVDDSETNIVEALEYTGRLFTTGVIKRIVLITDGKQSNQSDNNAIRRAVDELAVQDIKVDAIFLDDNPSANSKEVQISGVDYAELAYIDSEQVATLLVETSYDTKAELYITRTDRRTNQSTTLNLPNVELTLGRNNVEVKLETNVVGTYDYKVEVSAAVDMNLFNNTYYFTQTVTDEMKVLVVTHSFDDVMEAVNRYGSFQLDIYENDPGYSASTKQIYVKRQAGKPNIKININTNDVPYTVEALSKYDIIVLADVDVGQLSNASSFVSNVDTVVDVLGKSLVTFGNLHIQTTEDASIAKLGDMLPVNFGNTDDKLYTIIVDTSRSMTIPADHMELTKILVSRLITALPDNTYVTIVTFNSDATVIVPVTKLTERDGVLEKVQDFENLQGTVLGSGLRRTAEFIIPLQFDYKQVFLISDGLAYDQTGTGEDPKTVAAELYAAGVITSVYDVGRQGDSTIVEGQNDDASYQAAYDLLKAIAKAGGGNHYYSRNAERLDDVTFADIMDDISITVVERETTVSVQRLQQNDSMLKGLSDNDKLSIPNVNGYVYTGSKSSATTVLSVNHKNKEDSDYTIEKPLLAYQKYGSGMVTTVTTSLGGAWVNSWGKNTVADTILNNLINNSIPRHKVVTPYTVNVLRKGTVTRIELQPTAVQVNSQARLTVTLPSGEQLNENMNFNGSVYYFELDTATVGKYDVQFTYTYLDDYVCDKSIYVCYLDEYDAFSVFEPSALHRAIDGRGTVSEDGKLALVNDMNEVGKYVVDLTIPLLVVAVVLFIVDIIVRTLKWEDIQNFFGGGKKKKDKLANKEANK